MEHIYELTLLIFFIIVLIFVNKEVKECRIKNVYTRTYLGFIFILFNPHRYFKKECLIEGWIAKFIQILIIFGIVYTLTQLFGI
jgi:hypothetical protein